MLNIVLVEPEIPQNTGNIARTCAVTGAKLHLIEPLGFKIDDTKLKRAGLDYWHLLGIQFYADIGDFFERNPGAKPWLFTTKASKLYTDAEFTSDCWLMFGKETAGLSAELRERFPERCVKIPMIENPEARSLNLATSAAVALYEAIRQTGFLKT